MNAYGTRLGLIVDDEQNAVVLHVGRDLPGVLIGGYLGAAEGNHITKQYLDLNDLKLFHVNAKNNWWLDLQSSLFLHEVEEAYAAAIADSPVFGQPNFWHGYLSAHTVGILSQNWSLGYFDSYGRRVGGDFDRPVVDPVTVLPIPGLREYVFGWQVSGQPGVRREVITVQSVGTSFDITKVMPGVVENRSYAGVPSGDFAVIGVRWEVPEVLCAPLVAVACLCGVILRRTRERVVP